MPHSPFIPQRLRRLVAARAQFRCEYCQLQQTLCPESFEVDHVIPRALGGRTETKNLCYACPVCNNAKRSQVMARDPSTGLRVRLFNPRHESWDRHFRWSEDAGRIEGRAPVGRATVEALDMNRPRVILIRLLWTSMGLHPPVE